MEAQNFESVFDALADTPPQAANMEVRAELLAALRTPIGAWRMPQEAAAKPLGITRLRLNDLLRGKLRKFSLDALVNLLSAAGLELEIKLREAACPALSSDGKSELDMGATRAPSVPMEIEVRPLCGSLSELPRATVMA